MSKMKLGILISGGGTTMINLHEQIQAGRLDAEIACVVSSRSKVAGVERARGLGYPTYFVGRKKYGSDEDYSRAVDEKLKAHGVQLVVLAGFLRKYLPGYPFQERTINIHPALIPAFCGHGYYGMKVHQAVWEKGCRVSGCTVHLVNDEYDAGPIILQKAVAVADKDTPEDIRRKVFEAECEAYPEAIRYFIQNRIRFEGNRAVIDEL
ncbi:MAG: phosphoribosylglycinamide formyltransferase [Acidobacteriota bacterium]|nr:phosphoribosylglycinamide formyltransferase [Acidobacteriota bacterium]